jgi:hypothetical protein
MVFFVFHFILLQSFEYRFIFISDENISGAVLDMLTEESLISMGIEYVLM